MAYTPISQTQAVKRYVPIGQATASVKPGVNQSVLPVGQKLTLGGKTAEQIKREQHVPSIVKRIKEGKTPAQLTKELAQGVARGAVATASLPATLVSPIINKLTTGKATFTAPEFKTSTSKAGRTLFGKDDISIEKEGSDVLDIFGAEEKTKSKFALPLGIGLSALDLIPGGKARKSVIDAIQTAKTAEDVSVIAKNINLNDEIRKAMNFDSRVIAAKSPNEAQAIIKEAVAIQTPLPKLTTKTRAMDIKPSTKIGTTPAKPVSPGVATTRGIDVPKTEPTPVLPAAKSTTVEPTVEQVLNTKTRPDEISITPDLTRKFEGRPVSEVTIDSLIRSDITGYSDLDEKQVLKVMEDIKNNVPIEPIKVQVKDGNIYIEDGKHRVEALSRLGRDTVEYIDITKRQLPTLPKLPPEMAQRLRTKQADDTVSRAVLDRYKTITRKPPVTDSKIVALAKKATNPGETKKMFGELLTPISSRLRRINPALETELRKMEFSVNQNTAKSMEQIKPVLDGSSKMTPTDRTLFSISRLNGDREVYEALAAKYGITDALRASEKALDDVLSRANEAGMDIPKRENYHPRIVKNPKAYINYWRGQEDWGDINRLIEEEAKKKNITYTDLMKDPEKVAAVINNYIRGYGSKTVLSAPTFAKRRNIAVLDEELSEFYEDADTALATYMIRMNDEIEGRKFFGKKGDGDTDIQDSIGAHVMELVANGKIKPQQQEEVAEILRARFHRGKINGALDLYRNAEYISTMGSPISAITQIGDFAWSLYDNGFWNTSKVILGKKKVTREDLGLDASIMNEYTNGTLSGKAVEKTFKLVGLDKLARLGQETQVNATLARYQKAARANDDTLRAEVSRLFDANEVDSVIKELANGDITENTKFMAFNRLLDFQPLTKSEMPQVYLEHPNGRIFYMLKSFTLKQYDVFRREAFDKIATGNPTEVKQGVKNLVAIAGLFMAANATADEIKDLLLGRETPPSDRLVDNLWRLVGASKYDVYKAREEGIGTTVLRKILFPASIWDRASKDFETVTTDKEYEKGPMTGENYKFESTQTIPVGGKLYYWWFGRGAQKQEYKESSSKDDSSAGVPTLPELPSLPKLPKLPKVGI